MGIKYLWDTNIVIYYLQQQFPTFAGKLVDDFVTESVPAISAITEIELLSWKSADKEDLKIITRFIEDVQIIELEKPIKLITAEIRKTYYRKLPDAIIAATALHYDLILLTRNIQDFKNIEGLKLIDPWDFGANQ